MAVKAAVFVVPFIFALYALQSLAVPNLVAHLSNATDREQSDGASVQRHDVYPAAIESVGEGMELEVSVRQDVDAGCPDCNSTVEACILDYNTCNDFEDSALGVDVIDHLEAVDKHFETCCMSHYNCRQAAYLCGEGVSEYCNTTAQTAVDFQMLAAGIAPKVYCTTVMNTSSGQFEGGMW